MHTRIDLSENSPAAASAFTPGTKVATGLDEFAWISVIMEIRGGNGGILNVTLQTSEDGTTWYDWFRSNDIASGAAASIITVPGKQGDGTPVTIGKNTAPALAKGTVRPGCWQSRMRVLFETGAGMSAGAAQTISLYGYRPTG